MDQDTQTTYHTYMYTHVQHVQTGTNMHEDNKIQYILKIHYIHKINKVSQHISNNKLQLMPRQDHVSHK